MHPIPISEGVTPGRREVQRYDECYLCRIEILKILASGGGEAPGVVLLLLVATLII